MIGSHKPAGLASQAYVTYHSGSQGVGGSGIAPGRTPGLGPPASSEHPTLFPLTPITPDFGLPICPGLIGNPTGSPFRVQETTEPLATHRPWLSKWALLAYCHLQLIMKRSPKGRV